MRGALDIARKFSHVPHFAHSLELLLHETLQDHGTKAPASTPANERTPARKAGSSSSSTTRQHSSEQQSAQQHSGKRRPRKARNAANAKAMPLLQRVVEFLRRFEQFPEVVMSCARKTDVRYWRALFAFVGDPLPLFDRCVRARRVHTAASYLRILQNIAGVPASRRAALQLLELALDENDIEVVFSAFVPSISLFFFSIVSYCMFLFFFKVGW